MPAFIAYLLSDGYPIQKLAISFDDVKKKSCEAVIKQNLSDHDGKVFISNDIGCLCYISGFTRFKI